MFKTKKSVDGIIKGKVTLGAETSVAPSPVDVKLRLRQISNKKLKYTHTLEAGRPLQVLLLMELFFKLTVKKPQLSIIKKIPIPIMFS